MRMFELRSSFRFDSEAEHVRCRSQSAGQDHLQRDGAVEAELRRAVHDPHSTATDFF